MTNKNRKIFVTIVATILAMVSMIPFSKAFAGSGNVLGVPFSLSINSNKTAQQTLPGQSIQSYTNFDNGDKTRQAIVNAPVSKNGKFDFSATFSMKQSAYIRILFTSLQLWPHLAKPSEGDINSMAAAKDPGKNIKSYVDLVVEVDERITPASEISAYFDSHTWRPTHVFDKDYNLLKDVKNSYEKGKTKKSFTFPSNGKTKYIVRVVPIAGESFTNEQLDKPMSFGFDGPNNTNFTVSDAVANKIAAERRNMTEDEKKEEKTLLDKTRGLTEQEIQKIKKYNLFSYGYIQGKVTGTARGLNLPYNVSNTVPPAGIAVTYANPSVTFMRNYDKNDTEKIATVYAEYDKSINGDALTDQKMPKEPTREGYEFLGWNEDKNTTTGDKEAIGNEKLTGNKTVYAIWKKKAEYKVEYEFFTNSGQPIPEEVKKRLPKTEIGKHDGDKVKPADIAEKSYIDPKTNREWIFAGWDATEKTVNGKDVKFIGTWNYKSTLVDVTYKFKSGTAGKQLPQEIEKLKPKDEVSYKGRTAIPTDPAEKTYAANDGTWNFKGWDKQSVQVGTENVVFTGTWEFTPKATKKYDVNYKFVAKGTTKELPDNVKTLLPPHKKVADGTTVKASSFIAKKVTDVDNDGVWSFEGWDKEEQTVNGADITFVGTWTFKAKTYEAFHKFESLTKGKKLPADVLKRLPANKKNIVHKEVVMPGDMDKSDVKDGNGMWTFKGWTPEKATVNKDDVYFTGRWEYKENQVNPPKKTFKVVHKFVSGTKGMDLDEKIIKRLPGNQTVEDGKTAMPGDFNKEKIKTEKGVWSFEGWDADSKKVSSSDVTFTGVWKFTENKKPENDPKKPGQKPENKPGEDGNKPEGKTPDKKKPEGKKPPKTGDNSSLELMLAVLMVSGAGFAGFANRRRKNK